MPYDKGDLVEDIIKELTPLFENPTTTDKDLVEHADRLIKSMQARLKRNKILDMIKDREDRIAVLNKEIEAIEYEIEINKEIKKL